MASVLRSLVPLAALSGLALAGGKTCTGDLPLSCQNTAPVADTCCFIASGQLLQTQFWDASPSTGPSDSWTIHGLWPDNCDGSFASQCDPSRAYTGIGDILSSTGGADTLAFMQTYWKDIGGNDETFWEHEWGKHGTCISTLDPSCYTDYTQGQEATDFFTRTVALFKTLPTYDWLAAAGITPSDSTTYALADIQAALEAQHGASVTLGCKGKALDEVWYHFNVQGSLQNGQFVAADPVGTSGKCPKTVQYRPKSGANDSG
ncbi:Ribonuclease Trv [Tolypocladium capitatum]|uniref:ribonuclease T2 n=1 Tax=Tolypocladium capitatum TaxID=45235 RepID=A0A2K3QLE6_9HYPO|nr:Ribonuclease Trv [Tolypocladium capitatum]